MINVYITFLHYFRGQTMKKSKASILHRLSYAIFPMAFFLINSSLLQAQEDSSEVEELLLLDREFRIQT